MGKGDGDQWSDKDLEPRQTQPPSYEDTVRADTRADSHSTPKGRSCPKCCLKTRDCLMSAECGRALQISQVVAMCGMCIRFFI